MYFVNCLLGLCCYWNQENELAIGSVATVGGLQSSAFVASAHDGHKDGTYFTSVR